jgi:hypothetical protein
VLIVSELSRIGRDTVRTPAAILQIEEAGVEIRSYLGDTRITLADESGEIMTVFHSLAASFERRRARARTRDALERRAKAGAVTGGVCYGYRNVRDGNGYVRRVIDDGQARVVRGIFTRYAEGAGIVTIAHELNAKGVPSPRSRGWAATGVREMLYRTAYRGQISWGKLQKVTRKGTKRQHRRPESEWVKVSVPDLRIVPEDLWQCVHARLAERAATMPMLGARPKRHYPDESAYLLVGFVRCSRCRGPIGTDLRAHGSAGHRHHVAHYACLDHKRRGRNVCDNAVGRRQDLLDQAILKAITETLHPAVLSVPVEKALRILTTDHAEHDAHCAQLEHDLAQAGKRVENLVAVLADGALALDEIKSALIEQRARKTAIEEELARLRGSSVGARQGADKIRQQLSRLVADVAQLLASETDQARRLLRALLHDKIELEPQGRGRQRGYRFRGALTIGRLIAGTTCLTENTSELGGPNGIRTRFSVTSRVRPTLRYLGQLNRVPPSRAAPKSRQ